MGIEIGILFYVISTNQTQRMTVSNNNFMTLWSHVFFASLVWVKFLFSTLLDVSWWVSCGSFGENKKMKISARVRGEWFHIPCRDGAIFLIIKLGWSIFDTDFVIIFPGKLTVKGLADEALKRYQRLMPASPSFPIR